MIGGNTIAYIQVRNSQGRNAIGEAQTAWTTAQSIAGWLDLAGGAAGYSAYDAKIQESTHVFISDYQKLANTITTENSRMLVENKIYDITYIDDPMELHEQLEIYLKYTGGQ